MQSRLSATAVKFTRIFSSASQKRLLARKFGFATSSGRTADPAEVGVNEGIRDEKLRPQQEDGPTTKDNDPYVSPKSPIQSNPKLEHTVSPRIDPIAQQKRRNYSNHTAISLEDITCAGLDGSPWPAEDKETDINKQRDEQEADDKEYFKHHKASPLSEIEIADTRKPITRATDGTIQNDTSGNEGTGDGVWRPEQLVSAEESMRRATEIFRMNAVRGDPDSPHGRVLRELRGEFW